MLAEINCMHSTMADFVEADISKMSKEELRARLATLKRWRKKDFRQLVEDEAIGRPEHEGFIYILSNPTMPGILKIGCTAGTVLKRAAELNIPTGVPQQYKIERTFPVYMNPEELWRRKLTSRWTDAAFTIDESFFVSR